jgi:SAM-dependent methyltransferase
MFKTNPGAAIRRDCDERARKDALHCVATWRKDWTEEDFQNSGEQEYLRLIEPVSNQFQFAAQGASMQEVGCGAGRMTDSFARRFRTVCALDISAEMQNPAKRNRARFQNIHWVLCDGTNLLLIPNTTIDSVLCYFLLQHLQTELCSLSLCAGNAAGFECGRKLLFRFNVGKTVTMNWEGRLAWGATDILLWALNLKDWSQTVAWQLGFDPAIAGKGWRGAPLQACRSVKQFRLPEAAVHIVGGIPVA